MGDRLGTPSAVGFLAPVIFFLQRAECNLMAGRVKMLVCLSYAVYATYVYGIQAPPPDFFNIIRPLIQV